jgi:hypothetical protein
MFQRHPWGSSLRTGAGLVVMAVAVLAAPAPSEAKENRACMTAYKKGAQLTREAKFHAAKESMLLCTKLICSAALRKECSARVEQLTADAPTLVPEVTDDRGRPVTDVRITMDGKPWVSKVDGRAMPVDPGLHVFTFESRGVVFARERMVVLQGQRNRALSASLVWERSGREQDAVDELGPPTSPPPPVMAQAARRPPLRQAAPPPAPPPPPVVVQAPLAKTQPPPPMVMAQAPPQPQVVQQQPQVVVQQTPQQQQMLQQQMQQQQQQQQLSLAAAQTARGEVPATMVPVAAPPMTSAPPGVLPMAAPMVAAEGQAGADSDFRVAPYLTAALGLAGLGGAAALTYWGRRDNQILKDTCSPMCSQASVNHIKQLYLAANISAGVGAAALATWAYLVFVRDDPREQAQPKPMPAPALGFGLSPLRSGGFAAVTGTF